MRLHATLGLSKALLMSSIVSQEWEMVYIYSDSRTKYDEFVKNLQSSNRLNAPLGFELRKIPSLDRLKSDKIGLSRGMIEHLGIYEKADRQDVLLYSGTITHVATLTSVLGFSNILSVVEGRWYIEGALGGDFNKRQSDYGHLEYNDVLKIHGLEERDGKIFGLGVGEISLNSDYRIEYDSGHIYLHWGDLRQSEPNFELPGKEKMKILDHFCIIARGCHRAAGDSIRHIVEYKPMRKWVNVAHLQWDSGPDRSIETNESYEDIWIADEPSGVTHPILRKITELWNWALGRLKVSKKGKVQLILMQSGGHQRDSETQDCITASISVQSHSPDKVVLIRSRKRGYDIEENDAQKRFRAWVEGAESLVSEVTRHEPLTQPFLVPHTLPEGYIGNSDIEIEEVSCYNHEIIEKIDDIIDNWEGETRIDLLPGSKGLKVPIMLRNRAGGFSMWETLPHGPRMQYTYGMSGLDLTYGKPLSIIDRAWLSGFPVHAEVERVRHKGSDLPREDSEFFYGIAECFHEDDGGVMGLRGRSSLGKLAENHYYFEIIDDEWNFYDEGKRIRISKSNIERTFVYDRTPKQKKFHKSLPGGYFEEFVEASLWHAWDPVSTTRGLSIIANTVETRRRMFRSRIRSMLYSWEDHMNLGAPWDPRSWGWEDLCRKHGLDPAEHSKRGQKGVSELMDMELVRLSDCDEESRLWWLAAAQRTAEIDVVLLDKMGITTFDSKGKMEYDSGRDRPTSAEVRSKANKQSPDWLVHQKFYTVHTSDSSGQSAYLPVRIHMQRMWLGRRLFDEDIWSISSPLKHQSSSRARGISKHKKGPSGNRGSGPSPTKIRDKMNVLERKYERGGFTGAGEKGFYKEMNRLKRELNEALGKSKTSGKMDGLESKARVAEKEQEDTHNKVEGGRKELMERVEEAILAIHPSFYLEGELWVRIASLIRSTLTEEERIVLLGAKNMRWKEWKKILPHVSEAHTAYDELLVTGIRK